MAGTRCSGRRLSRACLLLIFDWTELQQRLRLPTSFTWSTPKGRRGRKMQPSRILHRRVQSRSLWFKERRTLWSPPR